MITPPLRLRNEHGRDLCGLSSYRSAVAASVNRIFRAIRDGVDVLGRAADRIAGGRGQREADKCGSGDLLNHDVLQFPMPPERGRNGNGSIALALFSADRLE